jgi:hypothetical protein
MAANERKKFKHHIEDSVPLRVVSSAMSVIGVLVASALADTPEWLLYSAVPGIVIGSWLSYRRRYDDNFIGKLWISAGILLVAAAFFKELLIRLNLSVADARIPLTNMLIALQALHCFDLPRRRDLGLSAIVGLTLLASAATLSHDTTFGVYLFLFGALGILLLRFDCLSRTATRAERRFDVNSQVTVVRARPNPHARAEQFVSITTGVLMFAVGSVAIFAALPRAEIGFLRHVRVSGGLNLSFLDDPAMKALLNDLGRGDGSIKSNPEAYYGFAETLDTNYRGELSDAIVLRVSSPIGTYWRGMAYDTFDGITWSMSKPKPVASRVCRDGLLIDLCPVPGLDMRRQDYLGGAPATRELTQVFYVEAKSSNLVVCAPIPFQIYFPSPALLIDHYGGLRSPVGVEKETVYTVVSHLPCRNATALLNQEYELDHIEKIQHRFPNYLQLPASMSPEVLKLTRKVAGQGNWYSQARKLCKHLQAGYGYDLNVGPTRAGGDSVSDFLLKRKRGFCEQFATAFVMMCRTRGIPARLVTGYLPGSYNALTGMWDVRLSDAHSWGEVYVPGAGWVSFDPTPDGPDGAFEGLAQRSTWSYFADQTEQLMMFILHHPFTQGASVAGRMFIEGMARLGTAVSGYSGGAVLVAIIVTTVVIGRRRSTATRKVKSSSDTALDPIASRSMKVVLEDLGALNVNREPSDTLADILTKTRSRLDENGFSRGTASAVGGPGDRAVSAEQVKTDFLSDLEVFFDDYARRRYGGKQGERSLKELSESLRKMIGILSKVE